MKGKYILFCINILILLSCKPNEITQNINTVTYKNIEDNIFHFCWVFKPGEYYLLADTIIYKFPSFDSKNIATIKIHEKINILEDVHNKQEIDNTTSCWYKIDYNNLMGYIFGGNIAKETFIVDIDNNGINDFFQYSISSAMANWYIDTRKDIIIFINNKKISTEQLNIGRNANGFLLCNFNFCRFKQANGEIIITLTNGSPVSVENYNFSINGLGNISFVNYQKAGRFFENGEWVEYEGEIFKKPEWLRNE